jgi:hypothetical protein
LFGDDLDYLASAVPPQKAGLRPAFGRKLSASGQLQVFGFEQSHFWFSGKAARC